MGFPVIEYIFCQKENRFSAKEKEEVVLERWKNSKFPERERSMAIK